MRIAVLSDAHGNLLYFKKCLDSLKDIGVDKIFYLGDFIGYFPEGDKVIQLLRKENAHCLIGNHEAMLLKYLPIEPEKKDIYLLENYEISDDNFNFLKTLLPYYFTEIDGKRMLFVHGHPYFPLDGYLYKDTNKISLAELSFDILFFGHTHRPYIERIGKKLLVNVGSCGMPRDFGNQPSYVIYDTISLKCIIYRLTLSAQEAILYYSNIHEEVKKCLLREVK